MVRGRIGDKVRKVGSSQIWFQGRLDSFLDSDYSKQCVHLEVNPLIWNLKTQNNGQILREGGSGILSYNFRGELGSKRGHICTAQYMKGP